MYTIDVREQMRDNADKLIQCMLLDEQPFRLMIWNHDNWDRPLPDAIMKSFPTQLVLDIKEMALNESYVDENTGEIILVISFEGGDFTKVLHDDEIIAIMDLKGQPLILNNFPPEVESETLFQDSGLPKTKAEILELIISDGIPEDSAIKSMDIFLKNNPSLSSRFS